ncbi:kinase-like domain-containing protein [Hypomontagnella monticulosa]|nr:kinase-like domain-containing protein [Hypomontagnella monticulosa]
MSDTETDLVPSTMLEGTATASSYPEELLPSALEEMEKLRRAADLFESYIRPGITLKDGRYRPFRKLGKGQSALVWLARDIIDDRYVAIKVSRYSLTQEHLRETSLLKHIREHHISSHAGNEHVIELLDDFLETVPGGPCACLVSLPLGRQVETVLSDFDEDHPAPYSFCRSISIQLLQALDYLHRQGIIHGDLHLGNVLLKLKYDIDSDSEEDIKAKNTRGNELNDPDDPFSLDDRTVISFDTPVDANIVLVDFGASTRLTEVSGGSWRHGYPIEYRAPEVVTEAAWVTYKTDVWALGCAIYRIIAGQPLFPPDGWDREELDFMHICGFVERLGPMPESLCTGWIDSDRYVTSDGHLREPFPEDERELPLNEAIREVKPIGMKEAELEAFIEFMNLIFRLEPTERSSTTELLQHRWVTEFGND